MFRVFKIVLTCLVFFFVFLGFIFWELFWGYNFFLKDVGQILLRKDHSVELRLENNKIARTKPPKFYHTLEQLPQYTIDFLIFQEDQNFFEHSGYSRTQPYLSCCTIIYLKATEVIEELPH